MSAPPAKIELPTEEKAILDALSSKLGDKTKIVFSKPNRIKISVLPENQLEVARFVRDELHFDQCANVTGTDFPKEKQIEVTYHFGSMEGAGLRRIILAVALRVPSSNPEVASLIELYPSADLHEREQAEMLGIVFKGHPNLTRLLLPEDWTDIPPMLKAYRLRDDWRASEENLSVTAPATSGMFMQDVGEDKLTVSIGPQHPGAGHFRFTITVEGDYIVDVLPDPGYVHRGAEKQTEYRTYLQSIPMLERTSLTDVTNIIMPFSMAAEELMGIEIPSRAKYLRMIMSENQRILSHLYWMAIQGIFLGHSTAFMWPMGDRDIFVNLGQMIGGARITYSYTIPGGVRNDMPEDFKDRAIKVFNYFEKRLVDYERIFFQAPLFLKRTQGVGVLPRAEAISLGVVGQVLRASNVKSDVRIDEPYNFYKEMDFEVPVYDACDTWARCMVHLVEMRQSMKIIKQCLDKMRPGPVRAKLSPQQRTVVGEAYSRVEAARGAMSFHIISDGSTKPYRVKISVPSFRNLIVLKRLLIGSHVADMPAIYWSLDYWPVEADK